MATLPGVKLYRSCGYTSGGQLELELASGVKLELVPMKKALVVEKV